MCIYMYIYAYIIELQLSYIADTSDDNDAV